MITRICMCCNRVLGKIETEQTGDSHGLCTHCYGLMITEGVIDSKESIAFIPANTRINSLRNYRL